MKRIICIITVFTILFSMVGCSNNSDKSDDSKKIVSGKYYLSSWYVMKFEDNGTVHFVEYSIGDKRKNYYATYSVEESSLTIKYSDKEYAGVILEDGQTILFGEKKFNQVELSDLSKETVAEFK